MNHIKQLCKKSFANACMPPTHTKKVCEKYFCGFIKFAKFTYFVAKVYATCQHNIMMMIILQIVLPFGLWLQKRSLTLHQPVVHTYTKLNPALHTRWWYLHTRTRLTWPVQHSFRLGGLLMASMLSNRTASYAVHIFKEQSIIHFDIIL